MLDLAIVGGGPGGLMSAWYLKKKLGELCRVTIYEASDRLGGKILTRKFDSAPAMYEAGVAEIYDYSMTGPDPLRELIQHFGLQTIPMDAEQVHLDGELQHQRPIGRGTHDAGGPARPSFKGWYSFSHGGPSSWKMPCRRTSIYPQNSPFCDRALTANTTL